MGRVSTRHGSPSVPARWLLALAVVASATAVWLPAPAIASVHHQGRVGRFEFSTRDAGTCISSGGRLTRISVKAPKAGMRAYWTRYHDNIRYVQQKVRYQATLIGLDGSSWKTVARTKSVVTLVDKGALTQLPKFPALRIPARNTRFTAFRVKETLTWLRPPDRKPEGTASVTLTGYRSGRGWVHECFPGIAPVNALSATWTSNSVDLTWRDPRSTPVAGVVVRYADGTNPPTSRSDGIGVTTAAGPATTVLVSNLEPLTTYAFSVWSFDAQHHYARPATIRVTTGKAPTTIPGAPLDLTVTTDPGNQTATFTWQAPTDTGGGILTGYRLSRDGVDTSGGGDWSGILPATQRSATFTRLQFGMTYTLGIQTVNDLGYSQIETRLVNLGTGVPEPVSSVQLTPDVADGTLAFTWTPPTSDNGSPVTGYFVGVTEQSGAAGPSTTVSASATSATLSGLTAGTTYVADVAPINANGRGDMEGLVVPFVAGLPSAPQAVTLVPDVAARALLLSWQAPASAGNSSITGYQTDCFGPNGALPVVHGTSTVFSATVKGLTTGSVYTCSVAAVNASNSPDFLDGLTLRLPAGVPGLPRNVQLTQDPAAHTATLTWENPTDLGATPLTAFRVARDGVASDGSGPWSSWTSATTQSWTFTNLTSGVQYHLSVQAGNTGGFGLPVTMTVTG